MADTDQDLEELGRQAREAANALRELSGVRRVERDSTEKNTSSKDNNTKATHEVNKALALYEKTIGRNISAAYRGEKAGKQFAIAIEQAADVLTVLIALAGPFGKLGRLIGVVAVQLAKLFGKESVDKAQKLYDTFQQIGTVGGGFGTSLEDLAKTAQQAGFGLEQLEQYSALIRQNASALSMFGGSVVDGTRQFSSMVEPLVYGRLGERLQNMGLSIGEIQEASARYTKLQTRLGFTQSMSNEELTRSTYGYLENLNLLSRLTGASVEQQQAAQDKVMGQQRFRAAYEEARLSGDTARMAKMQKAMDMYTYYTSIGAEDLAQGVADASTGFIGTSESSMQIYRSVPEIQRILNDSSLSSLESVKQVSISAAETQQRFLTAAKAGADISGIFGNTAQALDAGIRARSLSEENLRKVIDQQIVNQESSIAKFTQATIGLQYEARNAFQDLIAKGISPATDALAAYSKFVNGVIQAPKNFNEASSKMYDDAVKNDVPLHHMMADGGSVTAKTPYIVGEKGPEVFVPKVAGDIIPNHLSMNPKQALTYADERERKKQVLRLGSQLGDTGNKTIVSLDDTKRQELNDFIHGIQSYNGPLTSTAMGNTTGPALPRLESGSNLENYLKTFETETAQAREKQIQNELEASLLSDSSNKTTTDTKNDELMLSQNNKLDELITIMKRSLSTQERTASALQ